MQTPSPNARDFKISDSSMLQDSRTTLAQFKLDQNDFSSFDADFKTPFETTWKGSITDAENAPTDEQIVDAQANLTNAVDLKLKECANFFQESKYKIEKAFPNQEGIWIEFGYDNYDQARHVPDRMSTFMNVWHGVASSTKYKATLITAGFTQANIDNILTKRQALIDAKTTQKIAKNSRPNTTQNRVALMNKVWENRCKVAKVAKYIYANNFAKYKIYLLPASDESSEIFSIKGTVTENGTDKKLEAVEVSYGKKDNNVVTDSNGKYGFTKLNEGDYVITYNLAGYNPFTKNITFKGEVLVLDVALDKA